MFGETFLENSLSIVLCADADITWYLVFLTHSHSVIRHQCNAYNVSVPLIDATQQIQTRPCTSLKSCQSSELQLDCRGVREDCRQLEEVISMHGSPGIEDI